MSTANPTFSPEPSIGWFGAPAPKGEGAPLAFRQGWPMVIRRTLPVVERVRMRTVLWVGVLLAALLAGCATAPPPSPAPAHKAARTCDTGFDPFERDTLYFGRSIPAGGQVSDVQWTRFLEATVTPAFPQGLTVIDALGQWQGASGKVARERSKLVLLLHRRDAKADTAIAGIVEAYRKAFGQEAVLQERQAVCVRF